MGVVGKNRFDRVLLSILCMFKPSCLCLMIIIMTIMIIVLLLLLLLLTIIVIVIIIMIMNNNKNTNNNDNNSNNNTSNTNDIPMFQPPASGPPQFPLKVGAGLSRESPRELRRRARDLSEVHKGRARDDGA